MKSAVYLSELFPQAKFILMVRDGRATVHSIITRKVTITGFDLSSYRDCLTKWNKAVTIMYNECKSVGPQRCLMVHYEQLVLHPRVWLDKILHFLDVPWDDVVLHHEKLINLPGGISLSKYYPNSMPITDHYLIASKLLFIRIINIFTRYLKKHRRRFLYKHKLHSLS